MSVARCWIAGLSAVMVSSAAPALEVPLTVEEPIGAERKLEVVSGGIPLPAGKYREGQAFSLFDGAAEVPVQVSPMVAYPDGSLHWALVSFPVTAPAKSKMTYTLKDAPGKARPANPVEVKETGDVVEVSNGLVAFAVNRTNFNGFEWVKHNGKPVFKAPKAGLLAGGQGGPAKPTHFAYHYRGPVRTTLYVKGLYGDGKTPTFAMAVTLNAGEPVIHIAHHLRNGGKGAPDTKVADPRICLGLAGDVQPGQGGNAGGKSPAFGWQPFGGGADFLVFMRHGGRGNKGVYKVEAAGGELAIHLTAGDSDLSLAQGEHKITEIDLAFGNAASKEALSEPLHALASCAWYSANDSMGVGKGFGSLDDEILAYRNAGWTKADDPKKMPHETPNPNLYYGWFDAHATSECDHLQGLVFGYIRTGQRGFLDDAHAWARYWRTYLVWRSDEFVYGKDGKFNTPKWGTGRCCSEGCHFYGVGIFNYALITGDIDALEGAYDWGEMAGVAWYGPYAGKKPGDDFSGYGSRGFARSYLAVSRAYDVARSKEWQDLLVHYVNMATRTPARDPRGFTIGWSSSNPGAAKGASGDKATIDKLIADERVEIVGANCKHPKYGEYRPKCVGTWPEAMESMANYVAWEALRDSPDPVAQLAAEDAMDYTIAEACLGVKYAYNPLQKCVYYYMHIDYPLPDYVPNWIGGKWDQYQAIGTDSWYTKWWPNALAYGYALTGDRMFKDKAMEVVWWGLSRDYVQPPRVPQGEAPPFTRVEKNTKGDWMTPVVFALGVGAAPKKNETPPEPITDLKAVPLGSGKVELSWTAPKDEAGKVAGYQVKFADKPIKDYMEIDYREEFRAVTYWNTAKNVVGEPAPSAAGKTEKMTVETPAGKTVYFGIRSFDDSHNRSKLGNVAAVEVK